MPESFLAALRVVLPMALLIMLGVGVRKAGIMDRTVMRNVDKLTFRVFMPVLLFKNIYETDLSQSFAPEEAVFAALSLVLVIFPTALLLPPRLVKSRAQAASIGQAMIRSNYILFGIAVAESIFGEGNVGPVALLGAIVVPLTNALSVVVLEMGRSGRAEPKRLALSILKNPMVVAALAAIAASALPFRMPELLWGVVKDVAGVTTTISFISLGVGLDLGQARANRRPLFLGLALRMVLIPLIFLPLSVALGFRNQSLCGLMVLFAAPTAVASYPMAVAMGADGPLAGQLVCAGTILSIFTMFFYTFLFRSLGML
ncbi:AEC family transporter [uncultured Oscillibacter sp.]|uniref:AEC family transporter n=1 Tax=uncultured Oscillibacter sp. TaxID=876091 RepID=UPI0026195B7E|nr:AEC family transporter [uncultured Oscillibacter sp.]